MAGRYSLVGSDVAWESRGTAIDPRVRHIFSLRFGHEIISTAILPLSLIQEEHLSVNGEKRCALSTGYLPRGGLPRDSVDRITDRPNMTSTVDRGRKAKQTVFLLFANTSLIKTVLICEICKIKV